MTFLLIVLILVSIGVGLYLYLRKVILAKLPSNAPRYLSKSVSQKRIVFVGDSNTHGNMGHNWVAEIARDFPDAQIINAGVNADLAITLYRRLSEIIELDPNLVTILIGTNDVNATMSKGSYERYIENKKLERTDVVDLNSFMLTLGRIVNDLKIKTNAKIALISLPLIGENLEHEVNIKADSYSRGIQNLSSEMGIDFLDFRVLQKENLKQSKIEPAYEGYYRKMQVSLFLHYYLGLSWNKVSKLHNTQLTHDLLHQNEYSASLLKQLISKWVKANIEIN